MSKGDSIGFDPALIPALEWRVRNTYFTERDFVFAPVEENLVDAVWGSQQPSVPDFGAKVHNIQFAGETVHDKVQRIIAQNRKDSGKEGN